jgi:hypothetical protein
VRQKDNTLRAERAKYKDREGVTLLLLLARVAGDCTTHLGSCTVVLPPPPEVWTLAKPDSQIFRADCYFDWLCSLHEKSLIDLRVNNVGLDA